MISKWKIIKRNLFHHWSANICILLGICVSTAILTGALMIGDSMQHSLHRITGLRLGKIRYALYSQSHLFRTELADKISKELGINLANGLLLQGIAVNNEKKIRINQVQILGIDENFWKLSQEQNSYSNMKNNEIWLNEKLAIRLGAGINDEILIRMPGINQIPSDQIFSAENNQTSSMRLKVIKIVKNNQMGLFNLSNTQQQVNTAFLSHKALYENLELKLPLKSNMILAADNLHKKISVNLLQESMSRNWNLADTGLRLYSVGQDASPVFELQSDRIFLDKYLLQAASTVPVRQKHLLTYFVNTIRYKNNTTPYSFISTPGTPIIPENTVDNEIIITRWLADDLKVQPGEKISISYFVPDNSGGFSEKTRIFTLKRIIPLTDMLIQQKYTPDFPGLSDVDNCRDWDADIPIDFKLVRTKDEDYWYDYSSTPKAFITLNAAQNMWSNRFGNVTAVRFFNSKLETIEKNLLHNIDPVNLDMQFRDVLQHGIMAGNSSIDFSQLFLGLSFFLLISAMLLTALLITLSLKKRSGEIVALSAMGYSDNLIRQILLTEYIFIALCGCICGIFASIAYLNLVMINLKTNWNAIVGTALLWTKINPMTLVTGISISFFLSLCLFSLQIRSILHKNINQLTKSEIKYEYSINSKWRYFNYILANISLFIVACIFFFYFFQIFKSSEQYFFLTGFFFLIFCFSATYLSLSKTETKHSTAKSVADIGFNNIRRRRQKNMAILTLLSISIFMVTAVGANRKTILANPYERRSGTGGYAFFAETSIPFLTDINTYLQKQFSNLKDKKLIRGTSLLQKKGDDASCLNLNRAQTPSILGIETQEFINHQAFEFAKTLKTKNAATQYSVSHWKLLDIDLGPDVIPGIADQTVITWGLGKSVGNDLIFLDEKGNEIKIRLIASLKNSIFQGNILISAKNFKKLYPSHSGYNVFLIDSPKNTADQVRQALSRRMQNFGIEIEPAAIRLHRFNQVENMYLSIFLMLGGLALIIGTIGLGIVVVRNLDEDKNQLALLQSVGYKKLQIFSVVLSEHLIVLVLSLTIGLSAAVISLLPHLVVNLSEIPVSFIIMLVFIIFLNSLFWILIPLYFQLKRPLLPALRTE